MRNQLSPTATFFSLLKIYRQYCSAVPVCWSFETITLRYFGLLQFNSPDGAAGLDGRTVEEQRLTTHQLRQRRCRFIAVDA